MATGDWQCEYCGSPWCWRGPEGAHRCFERYEMSMRPKSGYEKTVYGPTIPAHLDVAFDPFDSGKEWDPDVVDVKDATRDDLHAFLTAYMGDPVFAKRFADCIDLIRAKNADYTQGTAKKDRIAAFRRISADIGVPMEKVWAIFCQKHWGAVMKFVKDGQVESEPIDGRINDIINYMVLLGAIIDDGKSG